MLNHRLLDFINFNNPLTNDDVNLLIRSRKRLKNRSLIVYRGLSKEWSFSTRRYQSFTLDYDTAWNFASTGSGYIYQCKVPANAVVAIFAYHCEFNDFTKEKEVIVDIHKISPSNLQLVKSQEINWKLHAE